MNAEMRIVVEFGGMKLEGKTGKPVVMYGEINRGAANIECDY